MVPIALFSLDKLTSCSGKHLEEVSQADVVFLMYELKTSAKSTDELCTGFDHDCAKRQHELADNKNVNGKYRVRIMLKDVFCFAEHEEKAMYGLRYKLTLTGINNNDLSNNAVAPAVVDAKIVVSSIDWYVPHYTLSREQQTILFEQS